MRPRRITKKPLPRAPVPGNVPLQKIPLQSPIPPPEKRAHRTPEMW